MTDTPSTLDLAASIVHDLTAGDLPAAVLTLEQLDKPTRGAVVLTLAGQVATLLSDDTQDGCPDCDLTGQGCDYCGTVVEDVAP
jgi:hypothetical protein